MRSLLVYFRVLVLLAVAAGVPVLAVVRQSEPAGGGPIMATGAVSGGPRVRPAEEWLLSERTGRPVATPDAGDQVSPDEELARVQHRLRALGVNYMRLGLIEGQASGRVYRFHCRLPVPDNPLYSRPFEAQAAQPLAAMESALSELEAWHARRQRLAKRAFGQ